MGATVGLALKSIQWFVRSIQFGSAAVILGIYSYFLAVLHNHDMVIVNSVRAVEGIAGVACVYTSVGLLLLCCLAGHPVTAFLAILLDVAFIVGMVYVAVTNRDGASSCTGTVSTVFGTGDAETNVSAAGEGFTTLPLFRTACRMERAVLAVSIVAAAFFVFSALVELALVRHRRKDRRFGPSPANNYTSGYGRQPSQRQGHFGFLSGLGRKRTVGNDEAYDPNALPAHISPDQVRDSYATEQTRVGTSNGTNSGAPFTTNGEAPFTKYETGYGQTMNSGQMESGVTAPAPAPVNPYRYDDSLYNRA